MFGLVMFRPGSDWKPLKWDLVDSARTLPLMEMAEGNKLSP